MTLTLVSHKDTRTFKTMWFYIDADNTVISPYFFNKEEAETWYESNKS